MWTLWTLTIFGHEFSPEVRSKIIGGKVSELESVSEQIKTDGPDLVDQT